MKLLSVLVLASVQYMISGKSVSTSKKGECETSARKDYPLLSNLSDSCFKLPTQDPYDPYYGIEIAYYFNPRAQKCEDFDIGTSIRGCETFESQEDCEKNCVEKLTSAAKNSKASVPDIIFPEN